MSRYLDPEFILRVERAVSQGANTPKKISRKTGLNRVIVGNCLQILKKNGSVIHGWFPKPVSSGSTGNKGVGVGGTDAD